MVGSLSAAVGRPGPVTRLEPSRRRVEARIQIADLNAWRMEFEEVCTRFEGQSFPDRIT